MCLSVLLSCALVFAAMCNSQMLSRLHVLWWPVCGLMQQDDQIKYYCSIRLTGTCLLYCNAKVHNLDPRCLSLERSLR
jgi:hypothetical protein